MVSGGETGWPGYLPCSRIAHFGKCRVPVAPQDATGDDARSLRQPGHPALRRWSRKRQDQARRLHEPETTPWRDQSVSRPGS